MTTQLEHAIMERMMEIDAQEERIKQLELGLYIAHVAMKGATELLAPNTAARVYLQTAAHDALSTLQSEEYMLRGTHHTPEVIVAPSATGEV